MTSSQNGRGCEGFPIRETDNIEHNPQPRTERGKRRHNGRNDAQKKLAEQSWARPRSIKVSKKQQELYASSGGRRAA